MMCSSGSWALPRETPSALFGAVSLDRKLQRPLLGKSRTLPSIPQSPVLSRLAPLPPAAYRDEMPEQKSYKKPSASEHQKGCTVPSAGHLWLVSTGSGGRNIIAALPTALALEICRCSQPSTVLAFGSALRVFIMFFYSHADPDEIRILLGQLV